MTDEVFLIQIFLLAAMALFVVFGTLRLMQGERGNRIAMGNLEALQAMKQAVTDAANAIKDLAAKSAGGQDISTELTGLAANLESAVSGAGEPTGTTEPTA